MKNHIAIVMMFAVASLAAAAADEPMIWRNPKDGMLFVRIPAGALECGATVLDVTGERTEEAKVVEFPQGFWMARAETTVAQFKKFVRQTGYITTAEREKNTFTWRNPGFKQADDHPVGWLSMNDAVQYAHWAGVDLPTQAEWLYACRAGTKTTFYWGDDFDPHYCWYRGNSMEGSHPVGATLPNPWGLYDMVGNAWEYCRVGDACFEVMGGSWNRCTTYRTRQGYYPDNLVAASVEPKLGLCDPDSKYQPYPYEDDRGFRCIRRVLR